MAKKKQIPEKEGQKKGEDGLTAKQRRFVDEYLVDLCATKAAIRAGFAPKRAAEQGYELLHKTTVSDAVQRKLKVLSDKTIMSADEVLKEYSRIGKSDILNYVKFEGKDVVLRNSDELTESEARAISEVSEKVNKDGSKSISFKLHSKPHSLDSLAKYHQLFVERHEHNHNISWTDLVSEVEDADSEIAGDDD